MHKNKNPSLSTQKSGFSLHGDEQLVSSLFSALKNDPDLRFIIERWSELSVELRLAIIKMIR
jgi:hypothetical protein